MLKIYLELTSPPQFKMEGIALEGQCDFVSIMVTPELSLKEVYLLSMKKKIMSKFERKCCIFKIIDGKFCCSI